ncbi:MAG TPA: hypothetical protein VGE64_07270 [Xanthomonadaceae bacterium]
MEGSVKGVIMATVCDVEAASAVTARLRVFCMNRRENRMIPGDRLREDGRSLNRAPL